MVCRTVDVQTWNGRLVDMHTPNVLTHVYLRSTVDSPKPREGNHFIILMLGFFDSSPKCLNQRQGELYVDPAVNNDDGDDDGDDDFSFQEGKLLAPWADKINFLCC